jgi:hypothetical protein
VVELMCPGCQATIAAGQPYCTSCLLTPVPRPEAEEPAAEPVAVGSTVDADRPASSEPTAPISLSPAGGAVCADPDCVHSGVIPASGCRHCGRRSAGTGAARSTGPVLLFPWGAVTLTAGRTLRIGREDSPLATDLAPYPNVSRRHADIGADDRGVSVTDLGSANGTFVNDRRIPTGEPVRVRPGDQIRFASTLVARVE